MKTAIISCVLALLMVLTSLTLFTIYGQNTRQNELEDSLSITIEQTLENLKTNQHYSVANTEEFIADFVENLVVSIDSDSDVKVEVLSVDYEKGLLDVNVIETFGQPNGSVKSISCRKTVILEEYSQDDARYFLIKFLTTRDGVDGLVDFKTYSICEGSLFIAPSGKPTKKGYTFKGWSKEEPNESNNFSPELVSVGDLDGELVVNEDLTFYAVFQENAEG